MKVEVKSKTDSPTDIFFVGNVLQSTDGYIVLVTDKGDEKNFSCVVIKSKVAGRPTGYHRTDAIKSMCSQFHGTITISN